MAATAAIPPLSDINASRLLTKGATRRHAMSQVNRTANGLEARFHPVSHYNSPDDVLNDVCLSTGEKRVILSSWASDMYGVESKPMLREVPGIPHKLRLDDILAALKRLDGDNDPPPRGGLALRRPRFSRLDCIALDAKQDVFDKQAPTRRRPAKILHTDAGWTREANVRRYRKLLHTRLTDIERNFIERRLAEELRGGESSDQPGTIGGGDDHARR
jgi:hypothetical protein